MKHKTWLLINLGSPASTATRDVRRYLNEFLMDKHVIDIAWPLRFFLAYGWIAPFRAPKSAGAYRKIWRDEGSPLIHFTREFAQKLANTLAQNQSDIQVRWAMRYGPHSVAKAMAEIRVDGTQDILIVPMYPQYAKSSVLTAIEEVKKHLKGFAGRVEYAGQFYDHPAFIESFAANIQNEWKAFRPDHLLLSYHGLPERHIKELDQSGQHCLGSANCCDAVGEVNRRCYRAQCFATSRALTRALSLPSSQVSVSFQSRLGREPWIQPFTDKIIHDLVAQGKRRLLVSCPSFVADCLETLEEVGIRLREDFLRAGGEDLRLVPSLNDSDLWVKNFPRLLPPSF